MLISSPTPRTDEMSCMVLAAMRLLTGTAGGGAQRKLDSRIGSTFDALVGAFVKQWQVERAAIVANKMEG